MTGVCYNRGMSEATQEKGKRQKKAAFSQSGNVLNWTFANGENLSLDMGQVPADLRTKALAFGLQTKVQNAWSGISDASQAFAAGSKTVKAILDGRWNPGRQTDTPSVNELAEAAYQAAKAEGKSTSLAQVRAKVEKLSATQRRAYAQLPAIAKYLSKVPTSTKSLDDLI